MFRSITNRRSIVILLGWLFLVFMLLAYGLWPRSSAVLAQRSEVAEAFMTNMSTGNSQAALEMMIHAPEDVVASMDGDFSNPDNFPVSWELEAPNSRHIVHGQATFPDGEELEVTLFLTWDWEKARWGIDGVYFGRDDIEEVKIRIILYNESIPYSLFSWGVAIIGLICVVSVIRGINKTNQNRWYGHPPKQAEW